MKQTRWVLAVVLALSFLVFAAPRAGAESLFTFDGGMFEAVTEKQTYVTSDKILVAAHFTNNNNDRKDLGNNYALNTHLFAYDLGVYPNLVNRNTAPSVFDANMTGKKITYVLPHSGTDYAMGFVPANTLKSGHVYVLVIVSNGLMPNGQVLTTQAEKVIYIK